jgi:hypothetical protein
MKIVLWLLSHAKSWAKSKAIQGIAVSLVCAFAAKNGWVVDNGTVALIIGQLADAAGIGFDPSHASQSLPLVGSALGAAWAAYGRATAKGPLAQVPPAAEKPPRVPGTP